MKKEIVIRDKDNKVINIGPWDYMEIESIDEETGVMLVKQQNPLPYGATSKEEEIIVLEDGGPSAAPP